MGSLYRPRGSIVPRTELTIQRLLRDALNVLNVNMGISPVSPISLDGTKKPNHQKQTFCRFCMIWLNITIAAAIFLCLSGEPPDGRLFLIFFWARTGPDKAPLAGRVAGWLANRKSSFRSLGRLVIQARVWSLACTGHSFACARGVIFQADESGFLYTLSLSFLFMVIIFVTRATDGGVVHDLFEVSEMIR